MNTPRDRHHAQTLRFLLPLVTGAALLLGANAASAATFNVKPVRLFLSASGPTTQVEITNDSAELIALELNAVRWSQDAQGKDVETPATEVAFFPRIFAVEPGARRLVRVGLTGAVAGEAEGTWRLYLTQLPLEAKTGGAVLRVMLRIGVPIFLAPKHARTDAELEGLAVEGCRVRFDLANRGTVNFRPSTIGLVALDGAGGELFAKEEGGWYVLSGSSQRRQFELPPEVCAKAASVAVRVEGGDLSLEEEVSVPQGAGEAAKP